MIETARETAPPNRTTEINMAYNHGTVLTKKGGFTYQESYGKDDSNWTGSASDERGNSGQKGGCYDLSATFKGGPSANQSGYKGGGSSKDD
jgi:hypothetical protein